MTDNELLERIERNTRRTAAAVSALAWMLGIALATGGVVALSAWLPNSGL